MCRDPSFNEKNYEDTLRSTITRPLTVRLILSPAATRQIYDRLIELEIIDRSSLNGYIDFTRTFLAEIITVPSIATKDNLHKMLNCFFQFFRIPNIQIEDIESTGDLHNGDLYAFADQKVIEFVRELLSSLLPE